jgi:hypothetical protein
MGNVINAHEFSNDLAVILRQCDVLIELSVGNPETRKHLRLIRQAALHMTDRIEDPRQFAQMINVFRSELHHILMDGKATFGDGPTPATPAIYGS